MVVWCDVKDLGGGGGGGGADEMDLNEVILKCWPFAVKILSHLIIILYFFLLPSCLFVHCWCTNVTHIWLVMELFLYHSLVMDDHFKQWSP